MKKKKRLLCIFSAFMLLLTCAPVVNAQESQTEDEDKTCAPYFYVESKEYGVDCFPLKKTDVKTTINGIIADTYVEQTYTNTGTMPVNASYVFPASTKVTIHGMQMQIGNQVVKAVIKEKEEAEEEFEEAKSEGKSASMLSEERPNVFTMDVANIMPGDEVRIELHYTELIIPTDGSYQFVFPTVVGPRYVSPVLNDCGDRDEWTGSAYLTEGVSPTDEYNIDVTVSTAVPITSVTSGSHDIDIDWNENTSAHITLADSSDYAGNRDFILDYKLNGEQIGTGMLVNKGEEENVFMLMIQPPERYEITEIPPREYIFVLDVSGSMSGFPLDTAKKLINNLVSGLRETDTFNLILFSGTSYKMSRRSVAATEENIKKAIQMVSEQNGAGGTELSAALEDAINTPADKDIARNIVIISDGYIYGEDEIFKMVSENIDKAEFFSFGIGRAVNRGLIEGIASIGQGEPFIVTEEDEAEESAEKFRTYVQSPILTDLKVSFDGLSAYDIATASVPVAEGGNTVMALPSLYAYKPIVLLGKFEGDATGTVNISGMTGEGAYTQSFSVADAVSVENDVIGYLWARKRVEQLTNYGAESDNPDVQKEVTQIGLDYSMITPYTSFIAVLDVVRNPDGESTDVNQPLPLPLEVSNLAIGYRIGAEPEEIILFTALLLIILMPILGKKSKFIRKGMRKK